MVVADTARMREEIDRLEQKFVQMAEKVAEDQLSMNFEYITKEI